MSRPSRIRSGFFAVYPPEHEEAGELITHDELCECGEEFTQYMPNERFLASLEARGQHAVNLFEKQCPGFWVPVHCPTCERTDLARQAKIDEARHGDHYDFRERAAG